MNDDDDVKVVFQDEVHFQVQTSITSMWVVKGSEPKVMSKPGKQNVAYSGYLIPETGELVSYVASLILKIDFRLNTGAILLGFFFSLAVGVIFGWAPAGRASRLIPIDALRSE